jgi:preprotein translocase subunit SecY
MSVLLTIHSVVRWLIVIVAVVAAVKFAMGWLRGGVFSSIDQRLATSFSGLIDLQVTLGSILLIWSGLAGAGFPVYRIEHAVTMIIAAVVAHLQARWKNADDKTRFRNSLFIILDTLIIIFIGLSFLPGGWSR